MSLQLFVALLYCLSFTTGDTIKLSVIIAGCLAIFFCSCSEQKHYQEEELKAFNDVFTSLFNNESKYYYQTDFVEYLPELFMDIPREKENLLLCSKFPEKYDSVLNYWSDYHKPFYSGFKKLWIEARGNERTLNRIIKKASVAFSKYKEESLLKRKKVLLVPDELLPFKDTLFEVQKYEIVDSNSLHYDSAFFYSLEKEELKKKNFNYSSISKTEGIILATRKEYSHIKKAVKNTDFFNEPLVLGELTFSRIAFNNNFTKGKFLMVNRANWDTFTHLVYVIKEGDKWKFHALICLKVFSAE